MISRARQGACAHLFMFMEEARVEDFCFYYTARGVVYFGGQAGRALYIRGDYIEHL